jgi:hypothetical protein
MSHLDLPNEKLVSRVEEDLEFLQMLSSPDYVEFLIDNKFFEDENFVYYLKHLDYIRNSKLIRLVKYPVSLKMLENLQDPRFVSYWIENKSLFTNFVNGQLFGHYIHLTEQKSSTE